MDTEVCKAASGSLKFTVNNFTDLCYGPEGYEVVDTAIIPDDRLTIGTYIPVECVYMNPLSSYSAVNLSSDYVYTVTEDTFYTDSFAFICNTSVQVGWGWKTMADAVENLEFYIQKSKWGAGHGPELDKNALYQKLDENNHLILADDTLYMLHGGPAKNETELVWGIYKLERRDDSKIVGGEIFGS